MTVSSYKKILKQLKSKSQKKKRFTKFNTPKERRFGKSSKHCSRCGSLRGHIDKYSIDLCRRCFREIATKIGFKKYS